MKIHHPKHICKIPACTMQIDELIYWLKKAKDDGATHFHHRISNDPAWREDDFVCDKRLTEEEELKLEIEDAEKRLEDLKAKR